MRSVARQNFHKQSNEYPKTSGSLSWIISTCHDHVGFMSLPMPVQVSSGPRGNVLCPMHEATDRLCYSTTHTLQKAFAKATPAWPGNSNTSMAAVAKLHIVTRLKSWPCGTLSCNILQRLATHVFANSVYARAVHIFRRAKLSGQLPWAAKNKQQCNWLALPLSPLHIMIIHTPCHLFFGMVSI